MIKTSLLGFGVTMHLGLCEQYVQCQDFLLARALMHCDNKQLQN